MTRIAGHFLAAAVTVTRTYDYTLRIVSCDVAIASVCGCITAKSNGSVLQRLVILAQLGPVRRGQFACGGWRRPPTT